MLKRTNMLSLHKEPIGKRKQDIKKPDILKYELSGRLMDCKISKMYVGIKQS